jgi:secreted trypsin-like serine protease
MTCYIGSTRGDLYLAGATSWGISNSETGCLTTYPSVYPRVSSFDSFIKSFVTNLP